MKNYKNVNGKNLLAILVVFLTICSCAGTVLAVKVDFGNAAHTAQQGGYTWVNVDSISASSMQTESISTALANDPCNVLKMHLVPSDNSEAGPTATINSWHRGVDMNEGLTGGGSATGTLGDLLTDFIYSNPSGANGIDIILEDLKADYYTVIIYFNDPGNQRNHAEIQIRDAASSGTFRTAEISQAQSIAVDTDVDPISSPEFIIQSNGTDDVTLRLMATYRGEDASAIVVVNGFDLAVSGTGFPSARTDLDVDFGVIGQAVQDPNFEEFSFENSGGSPSILNIYDSELGMGNKVVVTVTEEQALTALSEMDTFERTSGLVAQAALLNDFVYMYGDMSITLSNLKPGYYEMTTYHNDPNYPRPPVDILVQDSEGGNVRMAKAIIDQTGYKVDDPSISKATYQFKSDGSDVRIIFDSWYALPTEQIPTPVALINGFELDAVSPSVLQVDIGETGQVVKSGFVALTSADAASASVGYSNSLGSGTVTVENAGLSTGIDFNNSGILSDALNDDYASSSPPGEDGAVKLTVTGLADDSYTIYTNHNDPDGPLAPITISVNGSDVSTGFVQSSTSQDGPVATHAANFEVEGGSDVEIIMTVDTSEEFVMEEMVIEGDFDFDAGWGVGTGPEDDVYWFDREFGRPLCDNVIDANNYDDMATGNYSLAGWEGSIVYMNFSGYSNKSYLVQEIGTAVEGTQYRLNAELGWRYYSSGATGPDGGTEGHIDHTMTVYAGIVLLDPVFDLRDPNTCIDMQNEQYAAKSEISHTFTGFSNQFNWVPTGEESYTVTAGDSGKTVYVVAGGWEDINLGCCHKGGAQAVIDSVSVVRVSEPITLAAVLNGLEIIQNDTASDNHPAYCGDYGTVFLDADGNEDCEVNLKDLAVLYLGWLECNDPMADCN